jgi:monofunctional biosynthetic peptidoglycan transglycosylase
VTGTGARRLPRLAARGLLAVTGAWLAVQAITWPDVRRLKLEMPETTAFIERGRSARRHAGQDEPIAWQVVPRAQIARSVQLAVLAGEDDAFFEHDGFSRAQVREAIEEAWEEKRAPRGASTITQQLAKNLWLSPSRNPLRKVKEAMLTWQLERELEKARILELYLNVAEFGDGIYGVEAASRRYYGKSAAQLDDGEAAELAASLPRPKTWHPGVTSRGYRARVAMILSRMQRWPWMLRE